VSEYMPLYQYDDYGWHVQDLLLVRIKRKLDKEHLHAQTFTS